MTHPEIVWLVQELLPVLNKNWRLEIYDNAIQLYCYGDHILSGFECYIEYPMTAEELTKFIRKQNEEVLYAKPSGDE
jgi:hypothetical protein